LRGHFHFLGHFPHAAGFKNGLRERLLAETMFAHLHRHDAGRRMDMIGRGHDDRVDLLIHLRKHFTEILIPFGVRVFGAARAERVLIHVTEPYDDAAHFGGVIGVTGTFAARADDSDLDPTIEILAAHNERPA
jgi:hypothetical protein